MSLEEDLQEIKKDVEEKVSILRKERSAIVESFRKDQDMKKIEALKSSLSNDFNKKKST